MDPSTSGRVLLRTNKSLENETLPPMQETSTTPVAVPAWNINDITSDPVKSVAELIDWSDRFSPNSARLPTDRPIERWACRGQPRAFGTLKPSLTRNFRLQSIGAAEIIEHRLIEEFRKHYVRVPDLSADMPSPDKIGRHHDLRCLSVMQHYEIPTRLTSGRRSTSPVQAIPGRSRTVVLQPGNIRSSTQQQSRVPFLHGQLRQSLRRAAFSG
jgi:hypothetical protein